MRGKDNQLHTLGAKVGITPAYAGKSLLCNRSFLAARDHPRVCGEKTKKIP